MESHRTKSEEKIIKEFNLEYSKTGNTEKEKDTIFYNLKECIKEINCLYGIMKIIGAPNVSVEELFQKVIQIIPLGWSHPEITCVRIKLEDQEFKSTKFSETKWKLSSPIKYYNNKMGKLEIYYIEERSFREIGPFSLSEKKLISTIAEKLGHILDMKYLYQMLEESEQKFQVVFNNTSDAIFIHKVGGNFIEANQVTSDLLGYEKSELLNMTLEDIHLPGYTKTINDMLDELKKADYYCFETEIVTKDYKLISVKICNKIIELNGESSILSIVSDVTERKLAEEKMKRQLMKFNLEAGKIYLVKESNSLFAIEAFNDLLKVGYPGYILTRSSESDYSDRIKGNYRYIWISEKKIPNSLMPNYGEIEEYLEGIPRKSIVLIDRVDYLLSKNTSSKFLSFVHHLREMAHIKGITIIISADSELFSNFEMKLVEKETFNISLIEKEKLPDALLEILKFVYKKNINGIKPTLSDIGKDINITRPTIGKRINHLVKSNYLTVSVKGRNKVVELTNKGKELFS
ncbi:MAG TPA: PAS domain S-box protein [Methanofastidiosum sp.]|nr:PAS domain S-box protein [Methanofastidiosum sp.]